MRISVFGLGYVGCVTAVALAKAGHRVVGVDVSGDKVSMINRQRSPIVEPGLDEALREVVGAGRLTATESDRAAVAETDLALVCVGTPSKSNGQARSASARTGRGQIGRVLAKRLTKPYTVVVRSTVLPGTMEQVVIPGLRAAGVVSVGTAVHVVVNPEFMREGSALRDIRRPPFTIVGAEAASVVGDMRMLYDWVDAPFIDTDFKTAEMVKYASNAFHAMKISFANEMGNLCRALGADEQEVMRIFRLDRMLNISEAYLTPGFAFGGSCLPKDVRALLHAARDADLSTPVLSAILPSNDAQVRRAIQEIVETRKRRIGLVGLAFKSGTDDLRESPLVVLAEALIGKGFQLRILDHEVSLARLVGANRRFIEDEIPHITSLMSANVEELLGHAEVVVVGKADEEAARAVAGLRPDQQLIDLIRGAVKGSGGRA